MIKFPKTNPVNLDYFCYQMQTTAQKELPGLLGISESQCLFYGRAETVDKKKVVFIQGKDYEEIGIDDRFAFVFYLMMDDNYKTQNLFDKSNVSLYCHGDLKRLFPQITHRADEELRSVMDSFIHRMVEPQNIRSLELIEDMQPYHSFKINFIV